MSKITFRADDDLVDRLEECNTSKSEVMREALRAYLDGEAAHGGSVGADSDLEELVEKRVDVALADRLLEAFQPESQDVNVTITLDEESETQTATATTEPERDNITRNKTEPEPADRTCAKCGESIAGDHVYCPNCGEKASRRIFCECGEELRSDWAFCPNCGRRTPAADVLSR